MIDFDFIQLTPYTAFIGAGILVGLGTTWLFLRHWARRAARISIFLDSALLTLAASWLGARAFHILTHWDYYTARPDEIWSWGIGGLGMRGAFLAGMFTLALFAGARRLPWERLFDAAALGLAMGQAIGWLGAIIQGVNYGVLNESRFAMELPDVYGLIEPRFPVQQAEVLLFIFLFIGLLALAAKNIRPGQLFFIYLVLSSLGNGLLGFMRGDETAHMGLLRVDQVVDGALLILGLAGLLVISIRRRSAVSACGAATL